MNKDDLAEDGTEDNSPGSEADHDKDTPPAKPGDSETPLGDTDQHSDATG